jgi:hypothetical protein
MGTTPVRIVFHGGEGFFPVHAYITAAGQTSYDTTREREPLELEVPEGVALDLTITVTCPEWVLPRTSPELEIFHAQEPVLQQRFELVPPKAGRPPIYTPVDPTHPRLVNAAPYTPKDGGRSGFKIVVDLCFLNVTKWLARHKDGTLRQLHPDSPTENEQHGQDWRYRPYRPERGRCEFYELTAGSRLPRLWTVCHNLDQPPKHVLLFLMPKGVTHAGIGDLTGDWGDGLRRYLLSPARNEPFFLRIYNRNPEDCSWYTMVTHCGFFDQLVRSGKPVAVVLPLASTTAHGASDYGALGTVSSSRQRTPDGAPVDSDLRSLLQSLRRALAADGTLPPGMLDAAFRIAVSGFSAGAPNAVLLLERNQSAVDEFYWFDPAPNLTRAYRDKLTTWLGAKSTRRLRLIGGPYREPLLELWEQLRPEFDSTRVAAIPVPDYYRRSLVYKCAVSVPPGFPPSAQEQFWPAGSAAPPGSLSDRRNIYLELRARPPRAWSSSRTNPQGARPLRPIVQRRFLAPWRTLLG